MSGLTALLVLGWNELKMRPAVAAEQTVGAASGPAASAPVESQAERMEAIRRHGLQLLRADFPDDETLPPLARGDRLELHPPAKSQDRVSAFPVPDPQNALPPSALPTPPVQATSPATPPDRPVAAVKPAPAKPEADAKRAVEEDDDHAVRRHRHHTSRHRRARMAHAEYLQVSGQPQTGIPTGDQQADRAPGPAPNQAFGWVTKLSDAIIPSSWKSNRDNSSAQAGGNGN